MTIRLKNSNCCIDMYRFFSSSVRSTYSTTDRQEQYYGLIREELRVLCGYATDPSHQRPPISRPESSPEEENRFMQRLSTIFRTGPRRNTSRSSPPHSPSDGNPPTKVPTQGRTEEAKSQPSQTPQPTTAMAPTDKAHKDNSLTSQLPKTQIDSEVPSNQHSTTQPTTVTAATETAPSNHSLTTESHTTATEEAALGHIPTPKTFKLLGEESTLLVNPVCTFGELLAAITPLFPTDKPFRYKKDEEYSLYFDTASARHQRTTTKQSRDAILIATFPHEEVTMLFVEQNDDQIEIRHSLYHASYHISLTDQANNLTAYDVRPGLPRRPPLSNGQQHEPVAQRSAKRLEPRNQHYPQNTQKARTRSPGPQQCDGQ